MNITQGKTLDGFDCSVITVSSYEAKKFKEAFDYLEAVEEEVLISREGVVKITMKSNGVTKVFSSPATIQEINNSLKEYA